MADAHADMFLILPLVVLRYVDETMRSDPVKAFVRHATPTAATRLALAYVLSVRSLTATAPNALIAVAFVGDVVLATGLIALGVGLLRKPGTTRETE